MERERERRKGNGKVEKGEQYIGRGGGKGEEKRWKGNEREKAMGKKGE